MPTPRPRSGNTRRPPPSPPWFGALFTGAMFADAIWLLGYTLFRVPPLEALGRWNYIGALALFLGSGTLVRTWRGDSYVRPRTSRPRDITSAHR